ncbi:GAF domain-containing SpoIIE family protein phosphatase [Acidipila sp. EB88]|uniref:GAF domain-containing SpoIIE family protein phosphatase n=1 Tax=Acidipila sp. EB88 TaxID=2305226 RepID=UPI001F1CBBA4|nr:GAF domain-containing SpoIIE family protein phosphatase [Acidipila sp. EB88]
MSEEQNNPSPEVDDLHTLESFRTCDASALPAASAYRELSPAAEPDRTLSALESLPPVTAQPPMATEFLIRLAETLNTTLDLRTLLKQTAELVRAVLDFRIFAIFLINERTGELRMRFQIGHEAEAERIRLKIGQGIVGRVAETRQALLVNDVSRSTDYYEANPRVCSELAVPLIVKGRIIGVIDIESEQLNYFRPEHLHLLTLTASRISQAIENARLYSRVARQAQTLRVLNDISREFTSILDLPMLFQRIGELLLRLVDFQFFTIWIINENDGVLESRFATRFGEPIAVHERLPVNRGLVGEAIEHGTLVNAPDVRKDERYHMQNRETRSELIVPLMYQSLVIGLLDLEHTRANYFNEDHERTLTTLAAQIAISIENARLYQRVAQQEQRLEHDLDMAREVQLRLLPHVAPQHEHAEFAARFLPARAIGGDLYDFLRYSPTSSAVALGDVSGKAAPAALYAALVSGIMRSAGSNHLGPAEMLALLNDSLQERHVTSQYVAMVYAVWNDENMTLQIANAGATQPLFYRARGGSAHGGPGTLDIVQAEGFPLGMFPSVAYEEISLAARPGDALIFLSDGITDAQNPEGEMFGLERVMDLVRRNCKTSAAELASILLGAVSAFQGGAERFDDETVVVLRVR